MKNRFKFDFCWISDFRTPLMGIAILGVMLEHIASVGIYPKWFTIPQGLFSRLLFTEGFLLLSGLGLYFSFTKNPNVKDFYRKRLMRIFVPFVIMTFPFYLYGLLAGNNTLTEFLLNITSLRNFVTNNGMWYIAFSLLCYALFPLFYRVSFKSETPLLRIASLVLVAVLFSITMEIAFPGYYDNVRIGFDKIPIFIVGMYIGYLSLNKRQTGGVNY